MDNLYERVRGLKLPEGKYAVVGGAMQAYGIRDAKDIDILVLPKLFDILENSGVWMRCTCEECKVTGFKILKEEGIPRGEGVEIICQTYGNSVENIIHNAVLIDGVLFASLKDMLLWKEAAYANSSRAKDLADISLLQNYIQRNTG